MTESVCLSVSLCVYPSVSLSYGQQQLCDACAEIEDEIRFIDTCIEYNSTRSQLLNNTGIELVSNVKKPCDSFLFNNTQNIFAKKSV